MRTTTVPVDACAVLASAAATLADHGPDVLSSVLDDVVGVLDLRSAVLRDAVGGGTLRAVAGEVVHAVPQRRDATGPEAVVELPVHAGGVLAATLTVVGARPSQLPLLRALCAVLGLSLGGATSATLPLALLDAADADADAAADDLHDGPVQELVFARFAADAAVRGGDPVSARDAVQTALQSLRRSLWLLRPRGAGEGGLSAALVQLTERLRESGRPGLTLELDTDACADLAPQAASVGYRLVQVLAGRSDSPVAVRVHRRDRTVVLEVDAAGPLPAPERWRARAQALGAELATDPTGRAVLSVPTTPRTAPRDDIEAIP
jgi:hypothetical protein